MPLPIAPQNASTPGKPLVEPGIPVTHVYFLTGAVVSRLAMVGGAVALGVGMVGREGAVGISNSIRNCRSFLVRVIVAQRGRALRMTARRYRAECRRSPEIEQRLSSYVRVQRAQAIQTGACYHAYATIARRVGWL